MEGGFKNIREKKQAGSEQCQDQAQSSENKANSAQVEL